jgi:PPP family 3-phenylpropionic acid transporter
VPSLPLLRAFFFVSLGALGGVAPFLAARMETAGLDGRTIGLVVAMLPLGRLLSTPVWGWAADRFQVAGLLLRVGCALAVLGIAGVYLAPAPWVAAAGLFVFAAGRAPVGPLVDAITLRALSHPGRDPGDYGRIRLWGSIGFFLVALAASRLPFDPLILGLVLLGLTAALAFRFPPRGSGGPAPIGPALAALARRPFLVPLLLTACFQALTQSVYDMFFSTHVQELGLPASVTGWAITLGVCCEIVVMSFGRRILARVGAARALAVAAVVSIPRWWITAHVHDATTLIATQALHGITFGVFWIAGVHLMAERAPRVVAASAQSLFSAASYGVGALLGALLAGEVRARWGAPAIFEAMAGVACLSTACALWLVWADRAGADAGARVPR